MKTTDIAAGLAIAMLAASPVLAEDKPPYASSELRSPQAPDYESTGDTKVEGISGPATESVSRKAAGQAEREYEEKSGSDPTGLKGPATTGKSRATP